MNRILNYNILWPYSGKCLMKQKNANDTILNNEFKREIFI